MALSSCEAEYMGLSSSTAEALYLSQFLTEIDPIGIYKPVTIYEDNTGAIALTKDPVGHQRSKHIDIRYHFIRTEQRAGKINVIYCPSNEMIADIFTKPSTECKLKNFNKHIFG